MFRYTKFISLAMCFAVLYSAVVSLLIFHSLFSFDISVNSIIPPSSLFLPTVRLAYTTYYVRGLNHTFFLISVFLSSADKVLLSRNVVICWIKTSSKWSHIPGSFNFQIFKIYFIEIHVFIYFVFHEKLKSCFRTFENLSYSEFACYFHTILFNVISSIRQF